MQNEMSSFVQTLSDVMVLMIVH